MGCYKENGFLERAVGDEAALCAPGQVGRQLGHHGQQADEADEANAAVAALSDEGMRHVRSVGRLFARPLSSLFL